MWRKQSLFLRDNQAQRIQGRAGFMLIMLKIPEDKFNTSVSVRPHTFLKPQQSKPIKVHPERNQAAEIDQLEEDGFRRSSSLVVIPSGSCDVCLHVDTETNPAPMCRHLIQAPESSLFTAICAISRVLTAGRRAKRQHLPLGRVFFYLRSRHHRV